MPPHRQISQRIRLPLLFLFLLIPILAACHSGDTAPPPAVESAATPTPTATPAPANTPAPETVTDDTYDPDDDDPDNELTDDIDNGNPHHPAP